MEQDRWFGTVMNTMLFNGLEVQGSIPVSRTFLGQSTETLMYSNGLEGTGLHHKVWNIFGTWSQDHNAFHQTGDCQAPSPGPEHFTDRAPRH